MNPKNKKELLWGLWVGSRVLDLGLGSCGLGFRVTPLG